MDFLDFSTLKSATRLSREYHHEAAKRLYSSCHIHYGSLDISHSSLQRLEEGISFIARDDRVLHLSGLTISVDFDAWELLHPNDYGLIFAQIHHVLQRTVNLHRLDIVEMGSCEGLVRNLLGGPVAPHLKTFSTAIAGSELEEMGFWDAHQEITSVSMRPFDSPGSPYRLSHPLLKLRTVILGCVESSILIRGSPVDHINLSINKADDHVTYTANIALSTASIHTFTLVIHKHQDYAPHLYTIILPQMPHIRHLTIMDLTWINTRAAQARLFEDAIQAFQALRHLESLVWTRIVSKFVKDDFFVRWSTGCPVLREVKLRQTNSTKLGWRRKTYTRTSGSWYLVKAEGNLDTFGYQCVGSSDTEENVQHNCVRLNYRFVKWEQHMRKLGWRTRESSSDQSHLSNRTRNSHASL